MLQTLPAETIQNFLFEIKSVRYLINEQLPENTVGKLSKFENLLTLDEVEGCLTLYFGGGLEERLRDVFTRRWERIRNSFMCYTQSGQNLVNSLCLDLAKKLAPLPEDEDDYDALNLGDGPYFLLMPSLKVSEDVYGNNIHHLAMHQFVLSDGEQLFIPLAECLKQSSISDAGEFMHLASESGEYPRLTATEITRVSSHSNLVVEYYQALVNYNHSRVYGDGLGAHLQRLGIALRAGGVHAGNGGTEYNAGGDANAGIAEFFEYWSTLSFEQQEQFYGSYQSLREVVGRLLNPTADVYQDAVYCVEILAGKIDGIINDCHLNAQTLTQLQARVAAKQQEFNAAIGRADYQQLPSKAKSPKILPLIFQLPAYQQTEIFLQTGSQNAWMYALEHDPSVLTDFSDLLDDATKQRTTIIKFAHNRTPVMIAAMRGCSDAVGMLLDMRCHGWLLDGKIDIDARDTSNNTALIMAADAGQFAVVNTLLSRRAEMNIQGQLGDTALNRAIIAGHREVMEALLVQDATINLRNYAGKNAFDLVLELHPEWLTSLLPHVAKLPIQQQAAVFQRIPNGYNALTYAFEKQPHLFNTVLEKWLERNNKPILDAVYNVRVGNEDMRLTVLMMAVKLGNSESVRKLLQVVGADIDARDHQNNTALILAAAEGNRDTVNVLLDGGAAIDVRGSQWSTALHRAIIAGHRTVMEALLMRNADINSRNVEGKNAFDLVREMQPNWLEPILLKAATLTTAQQKELLRNVYRGRYDNVLAYALEEQTHLLDAILGKIIEDTNVPLLNAQYYVRSYGHAMPMRLTTLEMAVRLGRSGTVKNLLATGVMGINAQNDDDKTALIVAVEMRKLDTVNVLLAAGANTAIKSHDGNTALHYAALAVQGDIIASLLANGANLCTINRAGETVLDIAHNRSPGCLLPILLKAAMLDAGRQEVLLRHVSNGIYKSVFAYVVLEHPELIDNLLLNLPEEHQRQLSKVTTFMDKIQFAQHFRCIQYKAEEMKIKAESRSNYREAVAVATRLVNQLANAVDIFLQPDHPIDEQKTSAFKDSCVRSINDAFPVLEQHRGWKKVLTVLLLVLGFPVTLPLYAAGFFSTKTDSAQKLCDFEKSLEAESAAPIVVF